ncbi:MAG: UvrD-helicase domain-containing protein [Alphaproteobacteria bacterium]|nr:UvrD-helicase domain-containing protein [Alphaproteobacteria bacterium]
MNDPFQIEDEVTDPVSSKTNNSEPVYLENLNAVQREAVEATDGPTLVLAGAGTGKTRVLTTRLAHLLRTRDVRPYEILAVTFTNKAAREMRERVSELVGGPAEAVWLGTFHSLGARILRKNSELVGLQSNFTILDSDDQVRLLKQLLEVFNIDNKRWPARVMMGLIQRWKDRGLTPEKVSPMEVSDIAGGKLIDLYQAYQERLLTLNAADFGDLLLHCLTIFNDPNRQDILNEYQRRFRYILVDEYQDANIAQYLWLRLLAQGHSNITCVGDDDQSIYAWRGAEVGNILRFERDFKDSQVIRLEQNYRSTAPILAAASALISHNQGRLGKTLWTDSEGGEPILVRGLWDGSEEARFVSDQIESLQSGTSEEKSVYLRDIAILVRAGFQTRAFEERFLTLGLPYQVIGGARFYERMEIRDALAYLRVINQPDDDLAFERIINRPKRNIGEKTLQNLHVLARSSDISLYRAAAEIVTTDELKPRSRASLANLMTDFSRWRSLSGEGSNTLPHFELAEILLDECGYTNMLINDKSPEAPGRLENLKELVSAMEEFENLGGFLEHVSLVMDNNENAGTDMINIMTLHGAKGLEFDTVFLPGWEEGLFPHQRNMDESGAAGLEEERRLAYVGITRAKKSVIISFAANRQMHGQWKSAVPSRFIDELPHEHVLIESEKGLYETGSVSVNPDVVSNNYKAKWNKKKSGYLFETVSELTNDVSLSFDLGDRVFHQKFGYGKISFINGNKLDVEFEKAGNKKVIDSFVVAADKV